jgi:hypothetical protein
VACVVISANETLHKIASGLFFLFIKKIIFHQIFYLKKFSSNLCTAAQILIIAENKAGSGSWAKLRKPVDGMAFSSK